MSVQPQELPALYTIAGLARELGVSRAAAEAIFRRLPKVRIEGHQRTFVTADDVRAFLDASKVRP